MCGRMIFLESILIPRKNIIFIQKIMYYIILMLQKSTRMSEGHYETGFLWRDQNVELPNNSSDPRR